jgi:hypothetical protein
VSVDVRMNEAARRVLADRESVSEEGPRMTRREAGDGNTGEIALALLDRAERADRPDRPNRIGIDSGTTSLPRPVGIERISIDVRIEDRVEAVTLVLRDGELAWTCTDGTSGRESRGAPSSPWVRAALRWVIGGEGREPSGRIEPARSRSQTLPGGIAAPSPTVTAAAAQEGPLALAAALDDSVTEIARAGIKGKQAPGVLEALERAASAVTPVPTAVARWVGRVERAMSSGDARLLARLLEGAARGADDLRRGGGSAGAAAWMGATPTDIEQIVDRPMIEIARETLDGVQRGAIERRYLVDLVGGEILREERARTDAVPSLGPCPRYVMVGLGEVENGPAPRRLRIRQYTVALDVPPAELERVIVNAPRRAAMLVDTYREAITAWPALAEPVQVITCAGVEDGAAIDAAGQPIPIARDEDEGAAALLDQAVSARDVDWIVGRLIDVDGAVRLVPCAHSRRGGIVRLR